MFGACSRLLATGLTYCREWAFYISGFILCESILLILWLTQSPSRFVELSRDFGVFGIAVTVLYKTIVLGVMILTRPKTALDRRIIWHLGAMDALMIYALALNVRPDWFGLPPPSMQRQIPDPNDRILFAATLWYNIQGFIMWSAIAVLNGLYAERWRYARVGFRRILRTRLADRTTAD